jgi:hypothetical protein
MRNDVGKLNQNSFQATKYLTESIKILVEDQFRFLKYPFTITKRSFVTLD